MFRCTVLAYVALFGALSAFGITGVFIAALAVGVTVFAARGRNAMMRRRRALTGSLVGCTLVVVGSAFVLEVRVGIVNGGHVWWCKDNLKNIGIAMHNYHQKWESFPPAYLGDEAGQPAHSWRVLLLPFVERALYAGAGYDLTCQRAFEWYDFAEPWHSPNNSQLMLRSFYGGHETVPSWIYWCPAWPGVDEEGLLATHYLALIGDITVWGNPGARSLRDIAHPEHTILVVECFDRVVPWLEPTDIALEEAVAAPPIQVSFLGWWLGLTRRSRVPYPGEPAIREYHRYMGRHALFADGTVRLLPNDLSPADFRALADIRDVPKPVLPPPPPDHEAVPDIIQRLPFPPATIRWAGFVLFLAALAAMARLAMSASAAERR